jgi:predicted ATPase
LLNITFIKRLASRVRSSTYFLASLKLEGERERIYKTFTYYPRVILLPVYSLAIARMLVVLKALSKALNIIIYKLYNHDKEPFLRGLFLKCTR